MSPRFTIVLPTHNRSDVLPFALKSALAQTDADFELFVAGDGCTDDTARVISTFTDPRVRWFDLPKAPGIGYANRNAVLRHARGSLVAYLAHDDIWLPDHLERLGALFADASVELAYSRLLWVDDRGRFRPAAFNLTIPAHVDGLWRGRGAMTMSTVVHRTDVLERFGYWNESQEHLADFELWHRILTAAGPRSIRVVPEPTVVHFVADWRRTPHRAVRARVADWLVGSWLDDRLPTPLRSTGEVSGVEQAVFWQRLAADPAGVTASLRQAVTEYHDALAWPAQTVPGLVGVRIGAACGGLLEGLWWILRSLSPQHRRRYRALRSATRSRERERRRIPVAPRGRRR